MPKHYQVMGKEQRDERLLGQGIGVLTVPGLVWFFETVANLPTTRKLLFPGLQEVKATVLDRWVPQMQTLAASKLRQPPQDSKSASSAAPLADQGSAQPMLIDATRRGDAETFDGGAAFDPSSEAGRALWLPRGFYYDAAWRNQSDEAQVCCLLSIGCSRSARSAARLICPFRSAIVCG